VFDVTCAAAIGREGRRPGILLNLLGRAFQPSVPAERHFPSFWGMLWLDRHLYDYVLSVLLHSTAYFCVIPHALLTANTSSGALYLCSSVSSQAAAIPLASLLEGVTLWLLSSGGLFSYLDYCVRLYTLQHAAYLQLRPAAPTGAYLAHLGMTFPCRHHYLLLATTCAAVALPPDVLQRLVGVASACAA